MLHVKMEVNNVHIGHFNIQNLSPPGAGLCDYRVHGKFWGLDQEVVEKNFAVHQHRYANGELSLIVRAMDKFQGKRDRAEREAELLDANNRYLQRARDAEDLLATYKVQNSLLRGELEQKRTAVISFALEIDRLKSKLMSLGEYSEG